MSYSINNIIDYVCKNKHNPNINILIPMINNIHQEEETITFTLTDLDEHVSTFTAKKGMTYGQFFYANKTIYESFPFLVTCNWDLEGHIQPTMEFANESLSGGELYIGEDVLVNVYDTIKNGDAVYLKSGK